MNQTGRKIVQFTVFLFLAALLPVQFGCAEGTVRALDYSLESELYGLSAAEEQTGDAAPNPTEPADSPVTIQTATPAITPTVTPPAPAPAVITGSVSKWAVRVRAPVPVKE